MKLQVNIATIFHLIPAYMQQLGMQVSNMHIPCVADLEVLTSSCEKTTMNIT